VKSGNGKHGASCREPRREVAGHLLWQAAEQSMMLPQCQSCSSRTAPYPSARARPRRVTISGRHPTGAHLVCPPLPLDAALGRRRILAREHGRGESRFPGGIPNWRSLCLSSPFALRSYGSEGFPRAGIRESCRASGMGYSAARCFGLGGLRQMSMSCARQGGVVFERVVGPPEWATPRLAVSGWEGCAR
jgi:hypothetical protein